MKSTGVAQIYFTTRSSAQGNSSAKSLAGNVVDSSLSSLSSPGGSSRGGGGGWGSGEGVRVRGRGRGQGTFQPPCHTLHDHIVIRPKGTSHNLLSLLPESEMVLLQDPDEVVKRTHSMPAHLAGIPPWNSVIAAHPNSQSTTLPPYQYTAGIVNPGFVPDPYSNRPLPLKPGAETVQGFYNNPLPPSIPVPPSERIPNTIPNHYNNPVPVDNPLSAAQIPAPAHAQQPANDFERINSSRELIAQFDAETRGGAPNGAVPVDPIPEFDDENPEGYENDRMSRSYKNVGGKRTLSTESGYATPNEVMADIDASRISGASDQPTTQPPAGDSPASLPQAPPGGPAPENPTPGVAGAQRRPDKPQKPPKPTNLSSPPPQQPQISPGPPQIQAPSPPQQQQQQQQQTEPGSPLYDVPTSPVAVPLDTLFPIPTPKDPDPPAPPPKSRNSLGSTPALHPAPPPVEENEDNDAVFFDEAIAPREDITMELPPDNDYINKNMDPVEYLRRRRPSQTSLTSSTGGAGYAETPTFQNEAELKQFGAPEVLFENEGVAPETKTPDSSAGKNVKLYAYI